MSENSPLPWFRLYREFASDPKIQSLSEADQRRFIMLLCLQCSDQLENATDSEIACYLRINLKKILKTKKNFIEKNFIDEKWNIKNWNKRQFKSDNSTIRVQKHRVMKRFRNGDETFQKRDETLPDREVEAEADINKELPIYRAREEPVDNFSEVSIFDRVPSTSCKRPYPENFTPNDGHRQIAIGMQLDINLELEKFRSNALAKGNAFLNWDESFSLWLRRTKDFSQKSKGNNHDQSKRLNETPAQKRNNAAWKRVYHHKLPNAD